MILVTGAAGTVGTEVVKGLARASANFRIAYRNRKPSVSAQAVQLDLDRPETIEPNLGGVDTVFLLSNMVSPEINLVRVARAAGVRRIVKLSVWRAGDEAYSFARWHRAVEREIEKSGVAWTFLRPNGFMQNAVTYEGDTIRREGAFYLPAADSRSSTIDARDIAAVAVVALTSAAHDGKAYELSGPESLSSAEIAAILTRVLEREIRYVPVSPEDYKKGAMAAGVPEPYADALLDLYRYYRTGAAAAVTPTVREVIGREPIRFEQFARDYADALR
jgi:uncharacterized protein YbjT (DUF2867 family)